jgi:hypothetical protein
MYPGGILNISVDGRFPELISPCGANGSAGPNCAKISLNGKEVTVVEVIIVKKSNRNKISELDFFCL